MQKLYLIQKSITYIDDSFRIVRSEIELTLLIISLLLNIIKQVVYQFTRGWRFGIIVSRDSLQRTRSTILRLFVDLCDDEMASARGTRGHGHQV